MREFIDLNNVNLPQVHLKRATHKGYNYCTQNERYFVKKYSDKFILYDMFDNYINEFKRLYELKNYLSKYFHLSKEFNRSEYITSIEDYIHLCTKGIELSSFIKNTDETECYSKKKEIIIAFKEIAKEKDLKVSKSPYSNSFYACKKDEEIDWGEKPLNSYRLSDHWNFGIECHCKTIDGINYGFALCVMTEKGYKKIKSLK